MEAALLDLTRELDGFLSMRQAIAGSELDPEALEVEIELVRDDDDVAIEYGFADPWFGLSAEELAVPEDDAPVESQRAVHVIVGFGLAVALATFLHMSTL